MDSLFLVNSVALIRGGATTPKERVTLAYFSVRGSEAAASDAIFLLFSRMFQLKTTTTLSLQLP